MRIRIFHVLLVFFALLLPLRAAATQPVGSLVLPGAVTGNSYGIEPQGIADFYHGSDNLGFNYGGGEFAFFSPGTGTSTFMLLGDGSPFLGVGFWGVDNQQGIAIGAGGLDSSVTTTSSSFVIPAVYATVSFTVSNGAVVTDPMYRFSDGTHSIDAHIETVSGSNVTVTVMRVVSGAVGDTVASGATVQRNHGIAGFAVGDGYTTWGISDSGFNIADFNEPYLVGDKDHNLAAEQSFFAKSFKSASDGSNLGQIPPGYKADGTSVTSTYHCVQDSITAAGASTAVTLSGAAAFSSASSYDVVKIEDQTSFASISPSAKTASSFTFPSTVSRVYEFSLCGT